MDLGYGDMWAAFEEQAKQEGWSKEKRDKIAAEIKKGINWETYELAKMGVFKEGEGNDGRL